MTFASPLFVFYLKDGGNVLSLFFFLFYLVLFCFLAQKNASKVVVSAGA